MVELSAGWEKRNCERGKWLWEIFCPTSNNNGQALICLSIVWSWMNYNDSVGNGQLEGTKYKSKPHQPKPQTRWRPPVSWCIFPFKLWRWKTDRKKTPKTTRLSSSSTTPNNGKKRTNQTIMRNLNISVTSPNLPNERPSPECGVGTRKKTIASVRRRHRLSRCRISE